jgi:hypothetical protein
MGYKVRETVLVYVNNQYNDIEIVVDWLKKKPLYPINSLSL